MSARADDRLVPDLLAALEEIGSGPCCETGGCCHEDPKCDAMIARAAITKARGE